MRIPFIQHIGVGVDITLNSIRWVELMRLHNQVKIRRFEYEPVTDNDVEKALLNLVDRIQPDNRLVSTHLELSHVRQLILDAPAFDEDGALNQWINTQVLKKLPEHVNINEFVIRYQVLDETDEKTKCLVAFTRQNVIEERIQLFESVGLTPVIIGTGVTHVGNAFIFDENFIEDRSAVLLFHEENASLMLYDNGMLFSYSEIYINNGEKKAALEDAETHLMSIESISPDIQEFERLYITGNDAASVTSLPFDDMKIQRKIIEGKPLTPLANGTGNSGTDNTNAAALAVAQLYPDLGTINFLDDNDLQYIRQETEKKDALSTILTLGGSVMAIMLMLMLFNIFWGYQLNSTEEQLLNLTEKITAVDRMKADIVRMKNNMAKAKTLASERTNSAGILEVIGKSVPPKLWLQTLDISSGTGEKPQAFLIGVALNSMNISKFINQLEQIDFLANIRLIYVDTIPAKEVFKETKIRSVPLNRFEIRMDITQGHLKSKKTN